jgi:hypothetical protein
LFNVGVAAIRNAATLGGGAGLPHPEHTALIYFIQSNGDLNIKIGFTADDTPDSRLRAGETWNANGLTVLATMPGDRTTESQLHRRFALARVSADKEWFRPVPQLLQFIFNLAEREKPDFPDRT